MNVLLFGPHLQMFSRLVICILKLVLNDMILCKQFTMYSYFYQSFTEFNIHIKFTWFCLFLSHKTEFCDTKYLDSQSCLLKVWCFYKPVTLHEWAAPLNLFLFLFFPFSLWCLQMCSICYSLEVVGLSCAILSCINFPHRFCVESSEAK